MKRRKNYESPASLQQVEVLLELAFVDSNNVTESANAAGWDANYQGINSQDMSSKGSDYEWYE